MKTKRLERPTRQLVATRKQWNWPPLERELIPPGMPTGKKKPQQVSVPSRFKAMNSGHLYQFIEDYLFDVCLPPGMCKQYPLAVVDPSHKLVTCLIPYRWYWTIKKLCEQDGITIKRWLGLAVSDGIMRLNRHD